MNTKKFSEALSEIDARYIEKAINYHPAKIKRRTFHWIAVTAACLALTWIAHIRLFSGNVNDPVIENSETEDYLISESSADAAPMVFVNGILYQQSPEYISYEEMQDDFVYLGKIESYADITDISLSDDESMASNDGVPKENFQANTHIVGANVYQYGKNLVIQVDDAYWLYEALDVSESTDTE